MHVMDDWGNVVDCAALATISALLHFRRPEVTVTGNDVTVVSILHFPFHPFYLHFTFTDHLQAFNGRTYASAIEHSPHPHLCLVWILH